MKTPWKVMTTADWLLVLAILLIAMSGIGWIASGKAGSKIVVTSGTDICYLGDMGRSHSVYLDGPLGQTRLVINDQGAHITESPCPRKICVSMGPARYSGDLLACVPNQIMVRIFENENEEPPYDLLSR